ncbi:2-phospho-L-lactate transferase [Sphingomonas sp. CGMCC 1.13654]|uniref:2-phospho-L-lactate transferase n=1 Tax=Sphingomonas chungangi TaxID=2683589 RepID=A0A838L2H9_9SPHN|nr:2-phospho-L-lactate transferase [Sphingomonas chungangi]MBA2933591.1 2-phospho-L-lactate transferase [Sphingomonas chungangi]MVW54924.1 2-phospho-L-lactate transferase [Sphingomonas chungangi]
MSRVVVLTGGVGGAKLVLGLSRMMPPEDIVAVVNTGDDFVHLGLSISPDIDTLLYTLSGKANTAQGWGRENESWGFLAALRELGGEDWFALGDGDLALHVLRSHALRHGEPLSAIVGRLARAWDIGTTILPMSDHPVATMVDTDEGTLPFQRYFVARRCEPIVKAVRFEGAQAAVPAPGVLEAITDPTNKAVLIAPSNPFLSVDPVLAVPGIREALVQTTVPVVAVSPIIGGEAVKGPTAKLMRELGIAVNHRSIADHYRDVIDGLLVDERDTPIDLPVAHAFADTLMQSLNDRIRVARAAIALADALRA